MKKYTITSSLPDIVKPPLEFREPGRETEGSVQHPLEVVKYFEPIDVLNGAIELVDRDGHIITFHTEDNKIISENEYPRDYEGIYYTIADNFAE